MGNFLTSCKSVSFSRRTLLHGVCAVFEEGGGNGFLWLTDTLSLLMQALFIAHGNSDSGTEGTALQMPFFFRLSSVQGLFLYTLTFNIPNMLRVTLVQTWPMRRSQPPA
jgi:hypothetical protein